MMMQTGAAELSIQMAPFSHLPCGASPSIENSSRSMLSIRTTEDWMVSTWVRTEEV
jgi:hypothetical protein